MQSHVMDFGFRYPALEIDSSVDNHKTRGDCFKIKF